MTGIVDQLFGDPITTFPGADTNVDEAAANHLLDVSEHILYVAILGGAEQSPIILASDGKREVVVQYALMGSELL